MSKEESKPDNPDKQHFDKMLLKELVWKLDREIWAHVPNPDPSEQWSTSKAREESSKLISEYIENYDNLESQLSKAKELLIRVHEALTSQGMMSWVSKDYKEIESFLKS